MKQVTPVPADWQALQHMIAELALAVNLSQDARSCLQLLQSKDQSPCHSWDLQMLAFWPAKLGDDLSERLWDTLDFNGIPIETFKHKHIEN